MMKEVSDSRANIPNSLGIIPDGNRRWARENDLASLEGHKKGAEKLREVLGWCKEAGIKNAVVYAFSSENWKRDSEEVSYLKDLLKEVLGKFFDEDDERVALHFLGDLEKFGKTFARRLRKLEEKTRGREHHLYVAISYGGRAEILDGMKKVAREKTLGEVKKMTEKDFESFLWSGDMPEPDLIIRTSGEKRLSNFMTWKSVYSELAFIDSYFPALTKKEFFDVLEDYARRQRRRGV